LVGDDQIFDAMCGRFGGREVLPGFAATLNPLDVTPEIDAIQLSGDYKSELPLRAAGMRWILKR